MLKMTKMKDITRRRRIKTEMYRRIGKKRKGEDYDE